jgi:dynein heavy chain, axonemal
MPVVHITAALADKSDPKTIYDCPLYKTKDRSTTFVFSMKLKTKFSPEKWVLGGTALLLDYSG